jgi:hypothetical protein
MTVGRLGELGHDVRDIRGTPDRGLEDSGLWTTSQADGRVLIITGRGLTEFRGFALRHPDLFACVSRIGERSIRR